MRAPTADELAAIAAAYLVVTAQRTVRPGAPPVGGRWRIAARLPDVEERSVLAARTSRWNAAGRARD